MKCFLWHTVVRKLLAEARVKIPFAKNLNFRGVRRVCRCFDTHVDP